MSCHVTEKQNTVDKLVSELVSINVVSLIQRKKGIILDIVFERNLLMLFL